MTTTIDPAVGTDRARALFDEELGGARTDAALQALRNRWVARQGSWVAAFMERIARATPEEKKALGRGANELKKHVEAALAVRERELAAARRPAGAVDITLPGRRPRLGSRHPLSLIRDEVGATFLRLGYQVLEGPEIEDDYHNFEALNMPAEHPARDMQDTLYLAEPLVPASYDPPTRGRAPHAPQPLTLLRTHTSAMQIRHMERHDPPVRLVAIGPVYRRDNLDLTHTPMFHQVEGLVVGHGVTLADLKGTLTSMAAALFGEGPAVRFRPSFFPYTEPSAELDIRCIRCNGDGCPMCKRTGWLEILGSGMVHPTVFEFVGYDPDAVTGFAFGMGIERVALLKWGIEDIRLFYENDLRFLEQFGR
ncbi:MAG TPA: phenylalanine--tRNA ligase subunit alpha [Vicinamibacterales bacterium]|jgi:phenylalanyl-tRNA synthetase alpha chain|nr:phenylalanine--tRNA ligase subunit alpha [Vicinamibacterales bacterium]